MYRQKSILTLIISLLLLTAGCGFAGKKPSTHEAGIHAEELDPFRYSDEFVVTESHDLPGARSDKGAEDAIPPGTKDTNVSAESGTGASNPRTGENDTSPVFGYRIQIGIDQNKEHMERLVQNARSKLDFEVYLEYEAPFYRVRVGNFPTRKEAESQVRILKENGFKDALWVMSEINVQ